MKKEKVKLDALTVKSFTTTRQKEAIRGGSDGGICSLLTGCGTGGGMTQCGDSNGGKICR